MSYISSWFHTLLKAWAQRYRAVLADPGVLVFFLMLPMGYPIIYTLIYNPEVIEEVPVTVVDYSRTADSRELVRMLQASPYTRVESFSADLPEAKRRMMEREVYAVVVVPEDYSRKIGRTEQVTLPVYCDISLLFRYRSVLLAMTDIQLALGQQLRTRTIDESPVAILGAQMQSAVADDSHPLGDTAEGFGSFIMIGVLVLIIQQSLMLGVLMLGGGAAERRRANEGTDPQATPGPVSAIMLGRTLCCITIYLPLVFFVLYVVPLLFSLPHFGSWTQWFPLMLPLLVASSLLAESLTPLCTEREASFLIWAFTSVAFLFLSGLTWPVTAMSPLWHTVSALVPASWAVQGFVQINSNDAVLSQTATPYAMLWILSFFYFITAVCIYKITLHRCRKQPHADIQQFG